MLDTTTRFDADTQQQTFGRGNLPPDVLSAGSFVGPARAALDGGADLWRDALPQETDLQWFVARVRPEDREVRRAQDALRSAGYDTYHPRELVPGRKETKVRPLFVGYLLFGVRAGWSWGKAARAPGVLAVLGDKMTGAAIGVPDPEMERLRTYCGPTGIHDPAPPASVRLERNAEVEIRDVDSLFAGRRGRVDMDDGARVRVLIDILGGERVVEVRRAQLAVVE